MKQSITIAQSNWINHIGINSSAFFALLATDPLATLRVVDMVKHPEHIALYSHGKKYVGMDAIKAFLMEG